MSCLPGPLMDRKSSCKNNVKSHLLFDNRFFLKILHLAAIKLCRILILSTE